MKSFCAEGIILRSRDFGEADKLVTIFTKRKGKIKVLAKGVRKVSSRRGGSLDALNQVKVFLQETKNLPFLTEVEAIQTFPSIKSDLAKLSIVFLMFELIDQFFSEEQENILIFNLLLDSLKGIEKSFDLEKDKIFATNFQLKILSQIGYLPELGSCVLCNRTLKPETNFLVPYLGGLVDQGCSNEVLLSKSISLEVIKTLRFLLKLSVTEIPKLNLERKLLKEIFDALNFYTVFFLEKDLNSPRFATRVEKFY